MNELKKSQLEEVLVAVGLGDSPQVVKDEIMGKLDRATDRLIIESFWKHLNEKQTEHFKDFSMQMAKIRPELSAEGTLYDFMALYEDLTSKVSADLDQFLAKFVADFRAEV